MRVMSRVFFLTAFLFVTFVSVETSRFFYMQQKEGTVTNIGANIIITSNTAKAANPSKQYDLTSISGRELASIGKEVSAFTIKKCGFIKHTDGETMTFCLANFTGTTGGFYNSEKELMIVGSMGQYTLIHEIVHATTLHFYRKGFTDMTSAEVQEKMAYNAEHLLMQIMAFKEDVNISPDISDEVKLQVGIPIEAIKPALTKIGTVKVVQKKILAKK